MQAPPNQRPHRAILEWTVLLFLLLGVLVATGPWRDGSGPLARLDLALYDLTLRQQAQAPDPRVVIVAIDEASINVLGRWPWPRSTLAFVIDRLLQAGVSSIGVDILLAEPSREAAEDEVLANVLHARSASRVILSVGTETSRDDARTIPIYPLPEFGLGLPLGHATFVNGPDGVVRGLYQYSGGLPALALALVDASRLPEPDAAAGYLSRGEAGNSGWMSLPAISGGFRTLSAHAVLAGDFDPDTLRGRHVLLGGTAVGMGDTHATPLMAGSTRAAGIELHAVAASAILQKREITLLPPVVHTLLAATLLCLFMGFQYRLEPRTGLMLSLITLSGLLVLAVTLLRLGIWIQPTSMLISVILAYPLWSWRRLTAAAAGVLRRARDLERLATLLDSPSTEPPPREPISAHLLRLENAARQVGRLNQFLRHSLESLPHPVLIADERGVVVFTNQSLQEHFGAHAPQSGAQAGAWLERTLIGLVRLPGQDFEGEHPDRLHGRRWLVSGRREGERWLVQMVDVSAMRAAEREREQALSFLSHDLRSPHATIVALAERLASIHPESPEAHAARDIVQQARWGLEMTDQFIEYTRSEAKTIEPEEDDLAILVGESVDLCWFRARARDVTLQLIAPESAPLECDTALVRRALQNLIDNAIRHTPTGSCVDIRLERTRQPEGWLIGVADEGPGVAPELRRQIFEPYVQILDDPLAAPTLPDAEPTSGRVSHAHNHHTHATDPVAARTVAPSVRPARKVGAAGLGLAMVQSTARRHGGHVEVTDRTGRGGADFRLWVPDRPPRSRSGNVR